MPTLNDALTRPEAWSGMLMGNHALARAMLEAGTRVMTTYPGSPTPEIAAALDSVPKDARSYYFEYSTNEKVALEVAAGASMNGHLSTVFFKSVGLNVASDSMIQLPLMELVGGMVVILGDDPGANSSQNEQDNRHFCRMSYMPMLEPATPAEAYEMYIEAARLAQKNRTAVILRMTTHVCHAKQVLDFGPLPDEEPDWTPRFDAAKGPYIPIAKTVHPLKAKALRKLEGFAEESDATKFNSVLSPNGSAPIEGKRLGVISGAIPAYALLENLSETEHGIDIFKVGLSYPLPRKKITEFLNDHDEVIVIEELDRVMETEIKAIAWDERVSCRILSRTAMDDLQGELDPNRTKDLLARHWPELFEAEPGLPLERRTPPVELDVPPRLPQMCPGCGHRSAFHAIQAAIDEATITVGDIGCHSLGNQPPYDMGQMIYSMGASSGLAAGLSIGEHSRKIIAFLGDSTMFHAGLPGLLNAMLYDHDFTLVLLENGTTAMTGHQPRPGSGEIGDKINLVSMFETFGVKLIKDVDTYAQAKLTAAMKEALDHKGFSVVIARHPCMLKFVRDQKKKIPGFKMPQVRIDQDTCDRAMVCIEKFGCPSFTAHEDGSVSVHEDLCIGDGSCLPTCPVNAIGRPKPGAKK